MNAANFDELFSDINLPFHGVRLPEFQIDNKYKHEVNISEDSSNYDFLRALTLKGLKSLNLKKDSNEYNNYINRIKYELDTIKDLGFIDYILLVWYVINYCKENNIPVGLGRGSAAGSLILFLIGVTQIDSLKYDLYFERFISKIRAKKQEIDGVMFLDGT